MNQKSKGEHFGADLTSSQIEYLADLSTIAKITAKRLINEHSPGSSQSTDLAIWLLIQISDELQ